jgi:hypothetical protein
MKTPYEILMEAPPGQSATISFDLIKNEWDECKQHYPVVNSSGGASANSLIMAAILAKSVDMRRLLLRSTGEREDFVAIISAAQRRLTEMTSANPPAAAMYQGVSQTIIIPI